MTSVGRRGCGGGRAAPADDQQQPEGQQHRRRRPRDQRPAVLRRRQGFDDDRLQRPDAHAGAQRHHGGDPVTVRVDDDRARLAPHQPLDHHALVGGAGDRDRTTDLGQHDRLTGAVGERAHDGDVERVGEHQHRLGLFQHRDAHGDQHQRNAAHDGDARRDLILARGGHQIVVGGADVELALGGQDLIADDQAHGLEVVAHRPPPLLGLEQIDQRVSVDLIAERGMQRLDRRGRGGLGLDRQLLCLPGRLDVAPRRLGGQPSLRALGRIGGRTADHEAGGAGSAGRQNQQRACDASHLAGHADLLIGGSLTYMNRREGQSCWCVPAPPRTRG